MRGTAALLVIVLFAPVLSGCLNWNERDNEFYDCDSQEYWVDVSDDSPYPGLECESGPMRQLSITIFVYRDNDGVEWLINETSIATGIELINSIYNPYGIGFALDEIIWVDEAFPDVQDDDAGGIDGEDGQKPDTVNNSSEEGGDFGDQVSIAQLGDGFVEGYNPANVNIVMQSTGWGSYSMYPWYSREYYFSTVRASSFATSPVPSHELGHFLGLYHTHQFHDDPNSDSDLAQAFIWAQNWVTPTEQCYRTGDFICETPYDCYIWCEEVINCTANAYESDRPDQEPSEFANCTVEQHNPSRTNLMSRYGDRSEISFDQGARARYFIQYMSENEREGNLLQFSEMVLDF